MTAASKAHKRPNRARDSDRDAGRAGRGERLRAARLSPPSPDAVLGSAGRPLEPSVRRRLEEELAFDLSRVRIHNDDSAAALTDMIGADAVAVGAEIFFASGMYQPHTAQGWRLLSHEVLHTIQSPDTPAVLRLNRGESGLLSRRPDPVERAAEDAVSAVGDRNAAPAEVRASDQQADRPGWLRFVSVDVSQLRAEVLDPAMLIDRMAAGIVRSLRGDPVDASGRVRQQLIRLAPDVRADVLDRLEQRLTTAEFARVQQMIVDAESAAGQPSETPAIPEPVADPIEQLEAERDADEEAEEAEADAEDVAAEDLVDSEAQTEEDEAAEAERDEDAEARAEAEREQRRTEAERGRQRLTEQRGSDTREEDRQRQEDAEARAADQAAEEEGETEQALEDAEAEGEQAEDAAGEAEADQSAMFGGAGPPPPAGGAAITGAGAGGATGLGARIGAGGTEPMREGRAEAILERSESPLVRHGLRPEGETDEVPEQEQPLGLDSGAEEMVEPPDLDEVIPVTVPDPEADAAGTADGETDPRDLDPMPATDPDLSNVPTVEEELRTAGPGTLPQPRPAPSSPAPPPVEIEPDALDRAMVEGEQRDAEAEEADTAAEREDAAESAEDRELVESEPEELAERTPDTGDADLGPESEAEPGSEPQTVPGAGPEPDAGTGPESEPEPAEPAGRVARAPSTEPSPAAGGGGAGAGVADVEVGGAGAAVGEREAGEPGPNETMPGDAGLADPGLEPGGAAGPGTAAPEGEGVGGEAMGADVGAEGSLEPGGGECGGPQVDAAEGAVAGGEGAGGGGCGGGGGGEAEAEAEAESEGDTAADVEDAEPEAALATVGGLPAAQIPGALSGVEGSVNRSVGEEHGDLEGNPPELERPSGAPQTLDGPPESGAPVDRTPEPMSEVTPESLAEQRAANPPPTPTTGNPGERIRRPSVTATTEDDSVSDDEVRAMRNAISSLPTRDARLYTTVGPAPRVRLEGEADPELSSEQKLQTEERFDEQLQIGQEDSEVSLGEDRIYPTVPDETLTADIPAQRGGGGAGAAAAAYAGTVPAKALSAVAAQEKGSDIAAGVEDGRSSMSDAREQKDIDSEQSREDTRVQIEEAESESADEQTSEREDLAADAEVRREEWRREQDEVIDEQQSELDTEYDVTETGIDDEKADADEEVEAEAEAENDEIADEREEAEDSAREERRRNEEASDSWWGRAKAAVRGAFDAIASAITGIFDAAISAINEIKERFKDFVESVIDLAVSAITGLITVFADLALAAVDVVFAAFPEMRDRIRSGIEDARDAAIETVQAAAEWLKERINELIDALAGLLVAYLEAYRALLLFAVDLARRAVEAVLDFVDAAIEAFGMFAALVGDIASDPIGWISNLGSAAAEGTRNNLWSEMKRAIKEWFDQKVESVIGLGRALWDILVRGCLSVEQIGRMAWQAVISALPMMIISLVIEKVVSMIVPAAGAILTVLQGLQAAWGSISRIIAAFQSFFRFLQSVRAGGAAAACNFARAVAAGAVALLDFIANFLLIRLGSALRRLGGRLGGLARRVQAGLGRGARSVRRTAGRAISAGRRGLSRGAAAARRGAAATARVARRGAAATGRAARTGARRVTSAARSGARAAGRTLRRAGARVARSPAGRALRAGARRMAATARAARQRARDIRRRMAARRAARRRERQRRDRQNKARRLQRIIARLRPRLQPRLRRGLRGRILSGMLSGLRLWYRLSRLRVVGGNRAINATLNPTENFLNLDDLSSPRLRQIIREEVAAHRSTPQHQEMVDAVGFAREPSSVLDPSVTRMPSGRDVGPLPRQISRVTVPSGVAPTAIADAMRRQAGSRRLARVRVVEAGSGGSVILASVRGRGSRDPAGVWRPLVRRPSGVYAPDESASLSYREFGEYAGTRPGHLASALDAARTGDYDRLGHLPRQARTAAMVPLTAEPMRSDLLRVTGPARAELARASVASGAPPATAYREMYGQLPGRQRGAVGALAALEHRDQVAAGQPVRRREPGLMPGGATPDDVAAEVHQTVSGLAVVRGLVTEEGMRRIAEEAFREMIRDLLRNRGRPGSPIGGGRGGAGR